VTVRTRLDLALAATLVGCSATPAPSAGPGCAATVTHVQHRLEGEDDTLFLVLVIDAHVAASSDAVGLESELARGLRDLVVGDYDGDGRRDFEPFWQVRLTVMDARGDVMSATPSPPPEHTAAPPLREDAIEIWPGEGPDADRWQAWFADTARARIHQALTRESPAEPRLTAAVAALLERRRSAPALPGRPALGVVLVSDRDEATPVSMLGGGDEETVVALLGAIPERLLSSGAAGNFDALLAPQSFDEARAPCEDGRVVGGYPRRLLASFAVGARAGQGREIGSLCSADGARWVLMRAANHPSVEEIQHVCLPQPLLANEDGPVSCEMHVVLPAYGVRARCERVGLALDRIVMADDGPRERCVVPALSRREIGSARPGFYYDDFGSDLVEACGEAAPQALTLTQATIFSPGTELEADCFAGSAACGFELPDASASLDAR
jgi:hypothetical protein